MLLRQRRFWRPTLWREPRWYAPNWNVDGSGNAYCRPILGADLLTNGAFASDTAWTKGAGWTITGGAAVATTATGNLTQSIGTGVGECQIAFDLIYSGGGAIPFFGGATRGDPITASGSYIYAYGNNGSALYGMGVNTNFTGSIDNISMKPVSGGGAYLKVPQATSVAVKLPARNGTSPLHLMMCCDNPTEPVSMVYARVTSAVGIPFRVTLIKSVGGTLTTLIANTTLTFVAGAYLEVRRPSPTTFQLWYNGAQVGTTQTVSDSQIVGNVVHGIRAITALWKISEFQINGKKVPFRF